MNRGVARRRALLVLISLPLGACLVGPNPRFEGDGSAEELDMDDGDCAPGTLDCDGEPGCESDADDPETCGSCDNSCEFMGEVLECGEGLCSGTAELLVLGDAEIDSSNPDKPVGSNNRLYVKGGLSPEHAYIDLPGLDALPPGAEVHEASLYLFCHVSQSETTVHRIEGEWVEDTITWSNAPASDAEALATFSPVVGDNELDLLELLPAWADAPNYGIALHSVVGPDQPTNNDHVEFAASESAEMGPRLRLTLSW